MNLRVMYTAVLVLFIFSNIGLFGQQKDTISAKKTYPSIFLCVSDSTNNCYTFQGFLCNKGCYTIQNKYNYIFAKNCPFIDKRTGRAITPKYITIYDRRDETLTYLKLKNAKGYEYFKIKKNIVPMANTEMYFVIIAKDKDYSVRLESEEYFKEYEESFAKTISESKVNRDTLLKNSVTQNSTEFSKQDINPEKSNSELSNEVKLSSLNDALIILNNRYPEKAIINENYYIDLNCLRIKILENFGVIVTPADTLSLSALINEAKKMADDLSKRVEYSPFNPKIKSIQTKYFILISRQISPYNMQAAQIRIPDKDILKLSLEKGNNTILTREFKVRGGFKIDFSAGIFLTGLSVPEFIAQPHSFRYKQANLTVNPTSGQIDTVYTGALKDTIGNLIHTKNPRMNYAAGFLSHAYIRSGSFANIGLATGFLVNNDGFKMLLGGSLLLNIRKSRICISAGLAVGQQKKVSPTVERSKWKDSYKDGTIYNLISDLPVFFNSTDVPTYERWQKSWFFSLTYNFNSVSIRW